MKSSTVAYYKKIRILQAQSIHNMLTVVLSSGSKGYLMETTQMDVKSLAC
jgi:hypothetical protein